MTWQCENKLVSYLRISVSVVVITLVAHAELVNSYAHFSPASQAGKQISDSPALGTLKGSYWHLTGVAATDQYNLWVVAHARRPKESIVDGGRGVILASSDAGQSWVIQRIEEGKFLCGVHFVDRMTGWVSDGSNQILNTTDGGSSWMTRTAPAKSLWRQVQFIDSQRGWILGMDGKVLRTENGGIDWKLTEIAKVRDLFSLDFADPNRGWLVGANGSAYETTDSGAHWLSRRDEFCELLPNCTDSLIDLRRVKFVNSEVGFIAADVLSKSGAFSAIAVVFRTVDRGRTWRASVVPDALGIRIATFLTGTKAWIIPGNRANSVVRFTQDGGLTWSSLRLPLNSTPIELLFVDSLNGWLINGTDNFDSDQVYSTNDGGKTWIEIKISERLSSS